MYVEFGLGVCHFGREEVCLVMKLIKVTLDSKGVQNTRTRVLLSYAR